MNNMHAKKQNKMTYICYTDPVWSPSFHRTSPTGSSSDWAPWAPQPETTCVSGSPAPRPLPVLPAHPPLRRLWGDRLVWLDHLPPGIQRLPLQRLLPVPPGGKPQSDQPRHGALHHACAQALQRRGGGALLCPRQTPVHQFVVFRWWGERGFEAVWRHGGAELRLSLTGCAPPALFHNETMRDGKMAVCLNWFKHCVFVHMLNYCNILRNKTTIPQLLISDPCLVLLFSPAIPKLLVKGWPKDLDVNTRIPKTKKTGPWLSVLKYQISEPAVVFRLWGNILCYGASGMAYR